LSNKLYATTILTSTGAEFMTRVSGFERIAKEEKHVG
jgi:hypothetical protein